MKKGIFVLKFLALIIILFPTAVLAQSDILKVWPDGVPGSIQSDTYVERSTTDNGVISRIDRVTDPLLYVFLSPADISTGYAVVICPGGGYGMLASNHEGFAVARWLNENGISAAILKYRLPSDDIMKDKSVGPLQDAQEAMRIMRRNAPEWNINPDNIGIMGFSAGGHLASTLSTHYDEKVYEALDETSARPDFSLLIYPVITMDASFTHRGSRVNLIGNDPSEDIVNHFSNELQIDADTPPAFLIHSTDDRTVPVRNSIVYFEGLKKNNVTAELHIFEKGGHGYGLAPDGGTESSWPGLCISWLRQVLK
jgi:acetyl esterase/lipase